MPELFIYYATQPNDDFIGLRIPSEVKLSLLKEYSETSYKSFSHFLMAKICGIEGKKEKADCA
jgi:hypothetical protein